MQYVRAVWDCAFVGCGIASCGANAEASGFSRDILCRACVGRAGAPGQLSVARHLPTRSCTFLRLPNGSRTLPHSSSSSHAATHTYPSTRPCVVAVGPQLSDGDGHGHVGGVHRAEPRHPGGGHKLSALREHVHPLSRSLSVFSPQHGPQHWVRPNGSSIGAGLCGCVGRCLGGIQGVLGQRQPGFGVDSAWRGALGRVCTVGDDDWRELRSSRRGVWRGRFFMSPLGGDGYGKTTRDIPSTVFSGKVLPPPLPPPHHIPRSAVSWLSQPGICTTRGAVGNRVPSCTNPPTTQRLKRMTSGGC